MAQTTINYDKLIEIYSNPVVAYHPKTRKRRRNTTGILQMLRNICNLSHDDVSDKELIKELLVATVAGVITLPLLSIIIIFLEVLVA